MSTVDNLSKQFGPKSCPTKCVKECRPLVNLSKHFGPKSCPTKCVKECRPSSRVCKQKNNFLVSQPKHNVVGTQKNRAIIALSFG